MTTQELREHYAGLAMQALIPRDPHVEVDPKDLGKIIRTYWPVTKVAKTAFAFADAMMEQRKYLPFGANPEFK